MLIEATAPKYWIDNFYGYGSWRRQVLVRWLWRTRRRCTRRSSRKAKLLLQCARVRYGLALRHPWIVRSSGIPVGRAASREIYQPERPPFWSRCNFTRWLEKPHRLCAWIPKRKPSWSAHVSEKLICTSSAPNGALIPLFPLPAHNHAWYYAWLELPQFPFLKSRALYEDYIYSTRINQILKNITVYKPEVVVMCGMDNINLLQKSVQEFEI